MKIIHYDFRREERKKKINEMYWPLMEKIWSTEEVESEEERQKLEKEIDEEITEFNKLSEEDRKWGEKEKWVEYI